MLRELHKRVWWYVSGIEIILCFEMVVGYNVYSNTEKRTCEISFMCVF